MDVSISLGSYVQPLQFQPAAPSGDQANSALRGGGEAVRCLLIRHLPSWLNREEKESLFSHFGAEDVVIMPNKGKMKNCVFAAFIDHEKAKRAMEKLHQLDVFGSRLIVEYARASHASVVHEAKLDKWSCNTCKNELEGMGLQVEEEKREKLKNPPVIKQEIDAPPKAPLSSSPHYLYPQPTPSTIANITNAIACIPQLYVQVLHLMNKMNLPPPFGPPNPPPPTHLERLGFPPELEGQLPRADSSDEDSSEIESDEETRRKRKSRTTQPQPATSPKRLKVSYKQVVSAMPPSKRRRMEESIVEDINPIMQQSKRIAFHMPTELTPSQPVTEDRELVTVTYMAESERRKSLDNIVPDEAAETTVTSGQHLRVQAEMATLSSIDLAVGAAVSAGAREGMEQEGEEVERFITLSELTTNRMSETEMKEEHIFKNYSPGEPSVRLYLKNLSKQVDEKELRYIYGRYVNWSIEKEANMFNIQLMKTGRMKGQAFIGLPSEAVAAQALRETNSYLLRGKPIVVVRQDKLNELDNN